MLIAACEVYHKHGVDYQRWLRITAGDLDSLCVHMTYILLSLIGARAEVWHRDAITRKSFDVFYTPMDMLWPMKYVGMPEYSSKPIPKMIPNSAPCIPDEQYESRQVVSIESLIEA